MMDTNCVRFKSNIRFQNIQNALSPCSWFYDIDCSTYYNLRVVHDKGQRRALVEELQIPLRLVQPIRGVGKDASIQKSSVYVPHHASDVSQGVSLLGLSLAEFQVFQVGLPAITPPLAVRLVAAIDVPP